MKTAAALLVVLSFFQGCKIQSLDKSVLSTSTVSTLEECNVMAEHLDKQGYVRAFCINLEEVK